MSYEVLYITILHFTHTQKFIYGPSKNKFLTPPLTRASNLLRCKALLPTLSLQTCYFVSNYIFNSNQLVSFLIFCMDCKFRVHFPIKAFKWLKKENLFYYLGFVFVNKNVLHTIVLITINIDDFYC